MSRETSAERRVEVGAGGVGEEGVEARLELGQVVGREHQLGVLLGDAHAAELDGLQDDVGEALLEGGVAAGVLVEAGGEEALPGRGEVAEVAWRVEAGDRGDRGLGLGEEVVEEDELAADREVVGGVELEDLAEGVADGAPFAAGAAQGEEQAVVAEGGVGGVSGTTGSPSFVGD